MRRGYTAEAYLDLVNHIRTIIPGTLTCHTSSYNDTHLYKHSSSRDQHQQLEVV